jgi:hypothetical protein
VVKRVWVMTDMIYCIESQGFFFLVYTKKHIFGVVKRRGWWFWLASLSEDQIIWRGRMKRSGDMTSFVNCQKVCYGLVLTTPFPIIPLPQSNKKSWVMCFAKCSANKVNKNDITIACCTN